MMGIHIIDAQEDELGSPSSSSLGNQSNNSAASSSSDFLDDATSSPSSSSSSLSSSPSDKQHLQNDPLYQMSDLMEELPIKRGLSRYFQGKSQSFTSLSSVKCLEDLVKPQAKASPSRKRQQILKSSKSYGAGLDHTSKHLPSPYGCCSRIISKKPPSSAIGKRHHHHHHHHHHHQHTGFYGARPPPHPHQGSGNLPGQALLLA